MSPMIEPFIKHIPAWKKLGLKLKFAKEDADDFDGGRDIVNDGKKRKASNGDGQFSIEAAPTSRPAKKPKSSKTKDSSTTLSNGHSLEQLNTDSSPSVAAITTPSTKSKSVTFTPETKTQDGEGVKQLYKTWLDRQIAHDPSFDPSTVSPALRLFMPTAAVTEGTAAHHKTKSTAHSTSDADPPSRKTKKKKVQKTAKRSQASQPTTPSIDHPALTYLQTYHTSPKTWKFSKPHQNYLLKHLFSHTHIPAPYDTALLSYLRGLQGSARSRVRQQALATREEDDNWLATEPAEEEEMDQESTAECLARQKRDYKAAVARIKKRLRETEDEREDMEWELLGDKEEWEQRVRKRRRAEVVLWGVGEDEEVVEKEVVIAVARPAILGNSRPGAGAQAVTIQSRGMGGVRQISNGGIAEGSAGKKIVFGDDGGREAEAANGVRERNGVNGVNKMDVREGGNAVQQAKRKRKRKRRTGVPDDDESSSESSSSSSSDESEREKGQAAEGKVDEPSGTETSTSDSDSDSDSDTDTGSGNELEGNVNSN